MCFAAAGMTAAQMFATSLAVSVASTALSYAGQQQQANAQTAYQEQMARQQNEYIKQNAEAANTAYIEQAATTNIQLGQKQTAAAQDLQQQGTARLRAQGTATASSESAGLSMDMLMADYERQEATYRDSIHQQLEWDMEQGAREVSGFRAQAQDRINSARPYTPSPVSSPSLAGALIGFGGQALDAYRRFGSEEKDPTTKTKTFRL